jgi:hypothetical protein
MQFDHFNKIMSLIVSIFLLPSVGCTTMMGGTTAHYWPIRLDFLEDGKTLRKTVIAELGQPSGVYSYEGERFISYGLGKKSGQYFILDRMTEEDMKKNPIASWIGISGFEGPFNLRLEFDEHQVLQKHSLTKVQ